jgi:MoaA/NifB/PqqE/SkfB family radical SAM enzyme
VSLSVHGDTAAVHDRLAGTPGSFDQTLAGLRAAAELRPLGLWLRTSTVGTRDNLPLLPAIYRLLGGLGVDEVAFRVLRPQGRGAAGDAALAVPWRALAAAFRELVEETGGDRPVACLLGLPPCLTAGLGDHLPPPAGVFDPCAAGGDERGCRKRAECSTCARVAECGGVWDEYLSAHGWDEFVPVMAAQR